MGRRKFRLSDMLPNAWFYKLTDMKLKPPPPSADHPAKTRSSRGPGDGGLAATAFAGVPPPAGTAPNRPSCYYTTRMSPRFPPFSPPRRSRRRHRRHSALEGPLPSSPVSPRRDDRGAGAGGRELGGVRMISSATDIIIDIAGTEPCRDRRSRRKPASDAVALHLPPIVTKPASKKEPDDDEDVFSCELEDKHIDPCRCPVVEQSKPTSRKPSSPATAWRLKTRARSPRVSVKRAPPAPRCKCGGPLAGSFAVVKMSADPRSDFRESMEEMVAESGLQSPEEMEELLACYLALNCSEYHGVIVDVFEQIWFDRHKLF